MSSGRSDQIFSSIAIDRGSRHAGGVWQGIATGPGVSSWFIPTEVRNDGTIVSKIGWGMEMVATRTAWDPRGGSPKIVRAGSQAPPMAAEWIVEVRAGGRCGSAGRTGVAAVDEQRFPFGRFGVASVDAAEIPSRFGHLDLRG